MYTMVTDCTDSCICPAQTGLYKLISKLYIYYLQIKLFYITYDLVYNIILFEFRDYTIWGKSFLHFLDNGNKVF